MLRVFGCMVASQGGYRIARGWHYAKLSLSNAFRLSFPDMCILLFPFLSLCRFLCVCVFLLLSLELGRYVPLIFFCPADHVPDWQPRILLGMVEARSVNVKKTTTNVCVCFLPIHSGHQVRWTYQPGSHRRKVTQDFSSTFFLRCVPYFLSREGFSHSFPSSTVKPNFVY